MPPLLDRRGRPPGVLRLSLTARCNLACPYCCPDGEEAPDLLTTAERIHLVTTAVDLGVHTLRLTGGEPLLHGGLEDLIAALRPLRRRSHRDSRGRLEQIAITSNGALLTPERAVALKEAGLDRITLSLDGTDGGSVARMAGLRGGAAAGEALLGRVLGALEAAREAGFDPADGALKLNAVICRGRNDDQLLPLASLARERGVELRLIEFMDVGSRNHWHPEQVLPAAEMVRRITRRWPLEPEGRSPHGTALRWRYRDGGGRLAVVASITMPFCGDCNRLRVTADGIAHTCLFSAEGTDLRPALRHRPQALGAELRRLWERREDRYSEQRAGGQDSAPHPEMAVLGG